MPGGPVLGPGPWSYKCTSNLNKSRRRFEGAVKFRTAACAFSPFLEPSWLGMPFAKFEGDHHDSWSALSEMVEWISISVTSPNSIGWIFKGESISVLFAGFPLNFRIVPCLISVGDAREKNENVCNFSERLRWKDLSTDILGVAGKCHKSFSRFWRLWFATNHSRFVCCCFSFCRFNSLQPIEK